MPVTKCGLSFLIRCEDILEDHDRQQVHQFNYAQKSSGRRVSSTFSNISISILNEFQQNIKDGLFGDGKGLITFILVQPELAGILQQLWRRRL